MKSLSFSLVHEVQFRLLKSLDREGLLPVTPANLDEALERLEQSLDRQAAEAHEQLVPAIDRVWKDQIASIKADLREWLRRAAEDPDGWTPWRFELAFGLSEPGAERDPDSRAKPVKLDCGIQLRGSIDLVERRAGGSLRATDHKTGKARAAPGLVVGGGQHLQPALYALALEKLFPGSEVASGRLYYCTAAGGFEQRTVPLDERARAAAEALARTLERALGEAFLPAAPAKDACRWCDYLAVCGPYEELRTTRFKPQEALEALKKLRELT